MALTALLLCARQARGVARSPILASVLSSRWVSKTIGPIRRCDGAQRAHPSRVPYLTPTSLSSALQLYSSQPALSTSAEVLVI